MHSCWDSSLHLGLVMRESFPLPWSYVFLFSFVGNSRKGRGSSGEVVSILFPVRRGFLTLQEPESFLEEWVVWVA